MIRCQITSRTQLAGAGPATSPADALRALIQCVTANAARGRVDWLQIREKDLPAKRLAEWTTALLDACPGTRVLVNTRVDVALACGAAGVHLPSDAPPPSAWRHAAPRSFLFGVSCHSMDDVLRAEQEGAGYAFLSPVFAPRSKVDLRPPLGLDLLAATCRAVRIPVLALGGITWTNAGDCVRAGAAGIAGISMFLD